MVKEDKYMLECLGNRWRSVKDFFKRDWTMPEKILVVLCCVMFGMIKGFLLAPIKKGICCGCNNGNVYNQLEDECWIEEDEE